MLYFGPELMMPLASAAAAAAGAILMFWRRFVGALKAMGRAVGSLFRGKSASVAEVPVSGRARRRRVEGPSGRA